MKATHICRMLLLAIGLAVGITPSALGVPYASGVRNTDGSSWEFVLNQNADIVKILRDGGNEILMSGAAAGRHTFDMTGFSDFEIEVTSNAAAEWTQISDPSNLFTNFERGNGLAVNTIPSSPYFGTIYVINPRDVATASGRAMGDGVYSLTADRVGVDLANNFAVVSDANDTSQAKAPGWTVVESDENGYSVWRMTLDQTGNLIVADRSFDNGGIKYATPDLTSGGLILDQEGGPTYGVENGSGEPIHSGIMSKPNVTGSVGNDLVIHAMDRGLESFEFAEDGNHVWRWDVGSATNYDGAPQLVINASNLGDTTEGGTIFLNLAGSDVNAGVLANAHYEPQFDKWYLTEARFDGLESGLVVVSADGIDGNTPVVEWASGQFSIDQGWDSFPDDPVNFPGISEGTNDIFQWSGSVTISPDGSKMFLHRAGVFGGAYDNRWLGPDSNLPGAVLVIPLDENGLPIIEYDDNGTPEDPSDDVITNFESITIASNNSWHTRQEVTLDAAGNLYVTNNFSELFEVFSPGGNTRATTTSAGTFDIEALTGVDGDFNNDGFWTCEDINMLTAEIAAEGMNLAFDMNGDGMISLADVTEQETGWLAVGGRNNPEDTDGNAFLEGDANLDGVVDVSDFNEWNGNKFSAEDAWCLGDFNADGSVDVSDFNIWNSFKFQRSSDGMAAVPEPHSALLILTGVLALAGCRRRR